ncbi:MAG: damage-inducible protein DinB [Tabrizicola sp.]|nr:damage-inducible protein DinB [Tabrizicola sp.]
MSAALRLLRKLAQNNRLANQRLHLACAALPPGAWQAPRSGFFPSLRSTLNHILIVDRFYLDALEGGSLGPAAFAEREPCKELVNLADAQAAEDDRLLALVLGLGESDLDRTVHIHRGARVQTDRVDDVLSHLFQHQTHHRGQAHAMLSSTGVAPPQLDEFITGDDARFRREDLALLGWTEDALMR